MASGRDDQLLKLRLRLLQEKLSSLEHEDTARSRSRTPSTRNDASALRVLLENAQRRKNDLERRLQEERLARLARQPPAPQYMPVMLPPIESKKSPDYMELMMMQNAQLNQLVTSQLMLSLMRPQQQQQLPPPRTPSPRRSPRLAPSMPLVPPLRGLEAYLRRFRHISMALFFIQTLLAAVRKGKRVGKTVIDFPPKMLFGIQLKETQNALHLIYVDPFSPVYNITWDNYVDTPNDYALLLLNPRPPQVADIEEPLFDALTHSLEQLVFFVTDIMPERGVLGTHRKSFLYELIQEHQIFPDGYFYDVERDKLEFEGTGADAMSVVNVTDERAQLLLCSLFVMKSLVETVVLKPFKYKLIRGRRGRLDKRTDNNLNMLATLLTYVYRITFRDQFRRIMPMPADLIGTLYADSQMVEIYNRLRNTLLKCSRYLVTWSQEMVRRLRVTGSLGAGAVPQPNVRPEGELYWYERGYANPVGPIGRGKEFEVTGNMGN